MLEEATIGILDSNETETSEFSRLEDEGTPRYNFRKWLGIVLGALIYLIGYFHRFTPAVLSDLMAPDFGVSSSDLGIFSSMFFWPYGLLQPVVGSLADIVEPGYILGIAMLAASSGSLICGFSKSLAFACFGRFIVGLGCGAFFVPLNKVAANWLSPSGFRFFAGSLIGIGGIGSIMSTKPLEVLGAAIGWRMCFVVVGATGVVFAILALVFVRGHPSKLGFKSHTPIPVKRRFKESFVQLFKNLKFVFSISEFWLINIYMFFGPGVYMVVSGLMGVPFLVNGLGFTKSEATMVQMALSIAVIVASPGIPVIGTLVHSRKWTVIFFAVCSALACVALMFVEQMSSITAFFLYFVYSFGSTGGQGTVIPFFKELADSSYEASLVGGGNLAPFIGGGLLQIFAGEIVNTFEHTKTRSPREAYTIGVWGLSLVCIIMQIFGGLFIREKKNVSK